jgi:hypothetical protein
MTFECQSACNVQVQELYAKQKPVHDTTKISFCLKLQVCLPLFLLGRWPLDIGVTSAAIAARLVHNNIQVA